MNSISRKGTPLWSRLLLTLALSSTQLFTLVHAQTSCSSSISPSYSPPVVAKGYSARIVVNGLTKPRGLLFDSKGNLLVVEQGKGITALTLHDAGGNCLSVSKRGAVVTDSSLNHGIEMSEDGKTLYASNSDKAFSWPYDAAAAANSSGPTILVQGMDNEDHTTRTLLLSKKVENTLLVSRGSTSNIDLEAADITSGRSQIKSFNINPSTLGANSYDYTSEGTLLGWGLRNSVGVAEEPTAGGIWSVENSVDNIVREGVDIHENNPGEELNFHGYLNGTKSSVQQGSSYGYPLCYAAWNLTEIPKNEGLQVGSQFWMGTQNSTGNDTTCAKTAVPPRLTFPSHWAPLDIKFNSKGSVAYITSHGSWDKTDPDGYLLFAIAFANGSPTEPSTSTTAVVPILANADNSKCPGGCFRPVGLAWDSKGRLFMSSDLTGEIFVIGKDDGGSLDSKTLAGVSGVKGGGNASPSATSRAAAMRRNPEVGWTLGSVLALLGFLHRLL